MTVKRDWGLLMRHLIVVFVCTTVLASGSAFGEDWALETIAPFGAYFDLAVDAAGIPHVLFNNCQAWETCQPFDPANAELTYGTKTGTGWNFEPIVHDPVGDNIVIVLSESGVPHIAFKDSTRQMHYGYRGPGGWEIEDLYHEGLLRYRASPSLAFDSGGEPHIAFIERERIRYAFKQGGVWTDEEVTGSSLDNWSARASIAIDHAGAIHVGSWMYYESAVLFSRGASSWTYDLVGGDIAWNPWMIIDETGAAHFIYHGFNGVSYATNAGGSWNEELVDPDGANISDDIALDAEGRPFIVYGSAVLVAVDPYLYDVGLDLAWRDDGVWNREPIRTVEAVEEWWMNPRIEIDVSDVVHVLYKDPSTGELRYGTRAVPTAVGDSPPRYAPAALRISPNPFRRVTEVVFDLNSDDHVTLAVYDVRGRLVRMLANATMYAGGHRLTWDGRTDAGAEAPTGVYFVRLHTTTTVTRRAVLLK